MLRLGNFAGQHPDGAADRARSEFGVFAVALTVWTILGTLAEFGLGTDLVRARDLERRAPTVATLGLLISGSSAVVDGARRAAALATPSRAPTSAGVIRLMARQPA